MLQSKDDIWKHDFQVAFKTLLSDPETAKLVIAFFEKMANVYSSDAAKVAINAVISSDADIRSAAAIVGQARVWQLIANKIKLYTKG